MFFKWFNALANFQNYINKILKEKLNIFIIMYWNNNFIYIYNSNQGYGKAIKWMLNILKKNNHYINIKKCQFHKNKICFLSYVVLT